MLLSGMIRDIFILFTGFPLYFQSLYSTLSLAWQEARTQKHFPYPGNGRHMTTGGKISCTHGRRNDGYRLYGGLSGLDGHCRNTMQPWSSVIHILAGKGCSRPSVMQVPSCMTEKKAARPPKKLPVCSYHISRITSENINVRLLLFSSEIIIPNMCSYVNYKY